MVIGGFLAWLPRFLPEQHNPDYAVPIAMARLIALPLRDGAKH
jgi:hypothetical protein